MLPELERLHDVLAPTLFGHAGGPPLEGEVTHSLLADAVERAMDEAGFETAHIAGNSLGGYVALQLAARGRAESVVALAPAGGWAEGAGSLRRTLRFFLAMQEQVKVAAPHAGRHPGLGGRQAPLDVSDHHELEHIPADLLVHQMLGVVPCEVAALVEFATREGYPLDAEKIDCPVRIVWGTEDKLLPWPSTAARYRNDWLPNADWVELEGVGHCPQLDGAAGGGAIDFGVYGVRTEEAASVCRKPSFSSGLEPETPPLPSPPAAQLVHAHEPPAILVSMSAPLIEFPADDPGRARRFWRGVLGVDLAPRSAAAGSGWETETDSLRLGVHERGPGPGDTASLPYFTVADLATTLERVREFGGSVIHPGERWAVCRDSEGSPFALATSSAPAA